MFIRVYKLEIQSVSWYFRPSFVNCCPSNLLSGWTLPHFPIPVWISLLYTRIQCVKGGGACGVFGPQTEKHLPQSSFTGQFFKMTTFCIAFYESYLSTGFLFTFLPKASEKRPARKVPSPNPEKKSILASTGRSPRYAAQIYRARIRKRLRSPGIDSKESIPPS